MGVYHIFVNPNKKEYFEPSIFCDSEKQSALFHGLHRYALKILYYSPDFSRNIIGNKLNSWAGDPLLIAPDEAPPNQGMKTTSPAHPNRNLYELAKQEYRNISVDLLYHLIGRKMDVEFETTLFQRARKNKVLFITIVEFQNQANSKILELALIKHFGKKWKKQYSKMIKSMLTEPPPPIF